jgi:flagellar assembly protein FliH
MSGAEGHSEMPARLKPYAYDPSIEAPPCTAWDLPRLDAEGRLVEAQSPESRSGSGAKVDLEQRLADETRRSFESGRERGIEEGRAVERAANAAVERHRAEELRRLMEGFSAERDRYLHAVEHEVVRLALGIAARILRHEAQSDPLLLMGAVRVALGQLAGATEVRLHVPAADAELWRETIDLLPNPPVQPMVVAERDLSLGECRLEASLGQVDLSLRAQLDECERALFAPADAPAPLPAAAESRS